MGVGGGSVGDVVGLGWLWDVGVGKKSSKFVKGRFVVSNFVEEVRKGNTSSSNLACRVV